MSIPKAILDFEAKIPKYPEKDFGDYKRKLATYFNEVLLACKAEKAEVFHELRNCKEEILYNKQLSFEDILLKIENSLEVIKKQY